MKASLTLSVVALLGVAAACSSPTPSSPPSDEQQMTEASDDAVFLDQGWSDADRLAWERTSDGSGLIPLPWIVALEKPESAEMFLPDARKYGFLPAKADAQNPLALPVGLAKQTNGPLAGTTCSACHEAEVTFRGKRIRIYGGQGRTMSPAFVEDAVRALGATAQSLATAERSKFDRFATRVLRTMGKDPKDEAAVSALVGQVKDYLANMSAKAKIAAEHGANKNLSGPYRGDALGRGLNNVTLALTPDNVQPDDGQVSVPFLWDTPRFAWVEYNGSFRQPMARNVVSTLSRGSNLSFDHDPAKRFDNTVDLTNLFTLEQLVRKLKSPKWPEAILGRIDRTKAARGESIYAKQCASCHEPKAGPDGLLDLEMVALDEIGTDPKQAVNWASRRIDLRGFPGADGKPLGVISAPEFAKLVTQGVMDRNYAKMGTPPEKQREMNGNNVENEWRAPLAYRARPLNGIWATAPFLHNGSVPNLYELLLPEAERSKRFFVGSAELDVEKVGLEAAQGEFELDTTLTSNHNTGHLYGTDLDDRARWDVVEYLKTL
jgi:mono/diheme cytochrome c family protein